MELSLQLKQRPCEAYVNDMRVKAAKARSYHYPDIAVVCGTPEFEDAQKDTLLNPTLLIEVLSPSTEAYDHGGKFAHYRKIASLREYLLVTQDQPGIERYLRQGEVWTLSERRGWTRACRWKVSIARSACARFMTRCLGIAKIRRVKLVVLPTAVPWTLVTPMNIGGLLLGGGHLIKSSGLVTPLPPLLRTWGKSW